MWWIIGVVAAVAALFVFVRVRAQARHQALVVAAQNHICLNLSGFCRCPPGRYDSEVWEDKYLLGFINGSVSSIVHFCGDKSLNTKQNGMVLVDALRGINPDGWQAACERMSILGSSMDPEFGRGISDGVNVICLMLDRLRPELMTDPDIQAALANAPEADEWAAAILGPREVSQAGAIFGSAGGSLMSMYMQRHRELVGEPSWDRCSQSFYVAGTSKKQGPPRMGVQK